MSSKNFDLQHALDNYVDSVNKDASLTSSDEQELRTHILDATEDLQKTGLTNEEAFFIAVKRVGKAEIIAEEYRKVTKSFQTGNIWAYMLLGFGVVTATLWLYKLLSGYVALYLTQYFSPESPEIHSIIAVYNLLICVGIWSILKWGTSFSAWAQQIIQKKPWLTILIVFSVPACVFTLLLFPQNRNSNFLFPELYFSKYYYALVLNNSFAGVSYYLTLVSAAMITLLSVFSIAYPAKISFKSLFEKPSVIFLFLYGFSTELLAAMSRMLFSESLFFAALLFGIVYCIAAFLISYYNSKKRLFYLLIFSLFGFIAETWSGISADVERGNTIYTVYFVTALIAGILIGGFAGIKVKQAFTYKEELT